MRKFHLRFLLGQPTFISALWKVLYTGPGELSSGMLMPFSMLGPLILFFPSLECSPSFKSWTLVSFRSQFKCYFFREAFLTTCDLKQHPSLPPNHSIIFTHKAIAHISTLTSFVCCIHTSFKRVYYKIGP